MAVAGTIAAGVAEDGTKPEDGRGAHAGTTGAAISAGTGTGGAGQGGKVPSPRPNLGLAAAGQGLSVGARVGGIGGAPGVGAISAGQVARARGCGAACWPVCRSAWSSLPR